MSKKQTGRPWLQGKSLLLYTAPLTTGMESLGPAPMQPGVTGEEFKDSAV